MKIEYKVKNYSDNKFKVIQILLSDNEIDNTIESEVYHGNLCDCYAFIKLKEEKYM